MGHNQGPQGTAYELALFENDPDQWNGWGAPTDLIAPLDTFNYREVLTGRYYFGDEWRSTVDIRPFYLPPGKYWLDMHIVGPVNYFQSDRFWDENWFPDNSALWVNYEDFGGLQPCWEAFGDYFEVSFVLLGFPAQPVQVAIELIHPILFSGQPQGGLEEISASDDTYFIIAAGDGIRARRPYVAEVEFDTTVEDEADLVGLIVRVESRSDQPLVFQEISLFDFDADEAVLLDERLLPHTEDLTVKLPQNLDPQRFIRNSDGLVRIRVVTWSGAFTVRRPNILFDEVKAETVSGACPP